MRTNVSFIINFYRWFYFKKKKTQLFFYKYLTISHLALFISSIRNSCVYWDYIYTRFNLRHLKRNLVEVKTIINNFMILGGDKYEPHTMFF